MIKYLLAVLISFSVGMIIAPFIIKLIKRMNARQTILQYVQQHEAKQEYPQWAEVFLFLPRLLPYWY